MKVSLQVNIELLHPASKSDIKAYVKEAVRFLGGGLHPLDDMFANVKEVTTGKVTVVREV